MDHTFMKKCVICRREARYKARGTNEPLCRRHAIIDNELLENKMKEDLNASLD